MDEDGKRIVDFRLFEEQLLTDIIPYVEKKFRIGGKKELRAMAGLSMDLCRRASQVFNIRSISLRWAYSAVS